jgi:hypothetical protein
LLDVSVIRENHEVDFVYRVGVFWLIVALLAGAAGMLSMTSAKSAALVLVVRRASPDNGRRLATG